METLSEYLSNYVEKINLSNISDEVKHVIKQFILDTLACIFYGFSSSSASIVRRFSLESLTKEEATIIGINKKSSCANAILANGVALRQSEYMDYLAIPISDFVSLIHPSEIIPVALAISERENSSGEDFLLSVFIGYELSGRFCASIRSSSISTKGFHFSTFNYLILPLVIGKLLKMDFEELVNALGVSACQATLGIIDAEGEEYSMVKNIASPISAQIALVATSLAKYGFTGSRRVLEGEKGFIKSILREEVDLNELLKGRNKPWILETRLKPYPVCGAALGIADAAVNLARKYQINPLEIESILVRTNKRSVKHVGDPVKRYPKNKETADHSAPFIIALAFLKGDVKFEYFKEELYSNPEVIKIIDKVKLEISPELDDPKIYPAAEVEVKTKDGSKYIHKTIYHKGHPKNRMSDKEIEEKFLSASLNKLGEDRAKEVIKAVYKLDRIKNISEFTELLRV